ncbi:MAG: helix-turn-helix domain-containing protein [Deltaproteobacteria bacterium]|nr:helix-turn-helix domain-containing protein [Deltaproteobacteria bacterium]
MGSDNHHPLDEESGDWEFPSGKELGALLRDKREKMGLTYDQISERTKLRPHFIEALENEDWDHLPSPPFIKGFIRSYARVLGLSEEGLVGLYQEIAPREQAMPRPLRPVSTTKKRWPIYLLLVFAVLAGGFALYHWIEVPAHRGGIMRNGSTSPASEMPVDTKIDQDILKQEQEDLPKNEEPTPGLTEPDGALSQKEGPPVFDAADNTSADQPAEDLAKPAEQASAVETVSPTEEEERVTVMPPSTQTEVPEFILKANVKERTWVRVTIDDERPKEYIFGPESRPEWKAQKGFELLIGNAGGIDLEFNGEEMKDLGKQGQVIRLRLPLGYERSVSGD